MPWNQKQNAALDFSLSALVFILILSAMFFSTHALLHRYAKVLFCEALKVVKKQLY